jgi:hypothetical protein
MNLDFGSRLGKVAMFILLVFYHQQEVGEGVVP